MIRVSFIDTRPHKGRGKSSRRISKGLRSLYAERLTQGIDTTLQGQEDCRIRIGDETVRWSSRDPVQSPGSNRYPTHGSVMMYLCESSPSSFLRSWPMNTRRYSGCSTLLGPHTAESKARCVITFPACLAR